MAKLFDTQHLTEKTMRMLTGNEASWIYNGLDCCVTAEIYTELSSQMKDESPNVQSTHKYALAKLAPIMEMSMRGTRIDNRARWDVVRDIEEKIKFLDTNLQHIMEEVFEQRINWRSHVQLKKLFYDIFGCKPIKKRNAQGMFAPTVNEEALETISKFYLHAGFFARYVLILRSLDKQLSFLKTEIDPDGRMRTSYNITGTNTGRLSSRLSEFGTGTNLQNVNRSLRFPFIADPGMYFVNIDLEQADGRNVGAICYQTFIDMGRSDVTYLARAAGLIKPNEKWEGPIGYELAAAYLDACESGDLHTTVCRMVWPGLKWPELEKDWKKFCDSIIAHGQDSYRQLAKKGGHGTNYYGTPRTMAKHLHTSTLIIKSFQEKYFSAFPVIKLWHAFVIQSIKETGTITTPFGRRRMFWGRANDPSTHRQAIAYAPQSMTGEQIDRGLTQIWYHLPHVQLINQVHDSILLQIPYENHQEIIKECLEVMKVTLELKQGRMFTVPLDAKCGWNWGDYNYDEPEANPFGLKKWTGEETRRYLPPKEGGRKFADGM